MRSDGGEETVGSHAATMLMRSGVGKLRLVDFDQVSVPSLNRHAVATWADVGTPKVDAVKRFFKAVMPAWGRVSNCACIRLLSADGVSN